MGKGGINAASATQAADENQLVQIAQGQASNADSLFKSSFPGFQSAENFYTQLSSGDPYAISRALAPVATQADTAAAGAKKNILQTGPAGGEKNLALEQVDVNRGATVGDAASKGYSGSFNALASLAGQGIGESQSATGAALQGYGTAGNMALQEQQLQIQQKGNTLGAFSSLGGDAASIIGGGVGGGGGGKGGSPPNVGATGDQYTSGPDFGFTPTQVPGLGGPANPNSFLLPGY